MEEQGYERLALIEGAGLRPEDIDAPDVLITFRQHRVLINNALRITGDPDIGLQWGRQLQITALD